MPKSSRRRANCDGIGLSARHRDAYELRHSSGKRVDGGPDVEALPSVPKLGFIGRKSRNQESVLDVAEFHNILAVTSDIPNRERVPCCFR